MARFSRRSFVVGGGVTLATVPAVLSALQNGTPVAAVAPVSTDPYTFNLAGAADSPIPGGIVHRANKAAFPLLSGVAAFSLQLDPGAIRQPHLHTNANEISYIATGRARVGLVGPGGEKHLFELGAGELAYQPMGWPHWLENIGDGSLFAVFMYSHEQPATIDIPDVAPNLPRQSGQ
jgi:oxalate decarboxylase/phosphoglucose isomerase-like protein (cupin superfamily)